jgi:hypothetical protein
LVDCLDKNIEFFSLPPSNDRKIMQTLTSNDVHESIIYQRKAMANKEINKITVETILKKAVRNKN